MTKQLPDNHVYRGGIDFEVDDLQFCIEAFKYYSQLLDAQLGLVRKNSTALKLLSEDDLAKTDVYKEHSKAELFITNFQKKIDNPDWISVGGGSVPEWRELILSHGQVRYIKSVVELYLNYLRNERNRFARNPQATKTELAMLKMMDARINSLNEKNKLGVFEDAELVELLVDVPDEDGIEDQNSQKLMGSQINIAGNVSGSTLIIGHENKVQNSSVKEDELKRNLDLKRRIEKDFGDWLNYFPENRKRNSKMILRAFDSNQYPDSNEPDEFGEYSWFGAEIKSIYHNGIEFVYGIEELVIYEDNKWDFIKNTKDKNLERITVARVGRINFSDIVDYDLNGDEHYLSPHFFCKFTHKGLPFEETYFSSIEDKAPHYYFEFKDKKP